MNPRVDTSAASEGVSSSTAGGISVLVPVSERPHALAALYEEFSAPLRKAGYQFEFIFLFEPIFKNWIPSMQRLAELGEPIRVIEVAHTAGESTLLRVGAERARFDVLITLPPYPRIVAGELPKLIEPLFDGAAMAVARRWPRQDPWLNRLQSRIFHFMVGSAGGENFHDMACGVRAVEKHIFLTLPLYGTFHRFFPLLARRAGHRVVEVPTTQHPNDQQPRIHSPRTYVRRMIDVFGLYFLVRFTEKPLRFFGQVGALSLIAGVTILLILVLQRYAGQPLADRPMLLLGVLLVVLGVQAIALGLVGEMIVYLHAPQRRPYRLKDEKQRTSRSGESK